MFNSSEVIGIFPCLEKKPKHFDIGFFSDTIKARSFKLFMIINLLGVYIVILVFDDIHFVFVCQKYKLQIVCFGFLSSVV